MKVLVKLFQKLAVSKGGAFGRPSQRAKSPIVQSARKRVNCFSLAESKREKTTSGVFSLFYSNSKLTFKRIFKNRVIHFHSKYVVIHG